MEEEIKKTEYKDIYELEQECIRLTTDLKKRGMYKGFKETLTKLYTKSGHFVFELIQNAEDCDAEEIIFELKKDKLIFKHDGKKLFTLANVDAITNVGNSTKNEEGNSIGKFGVGFKSVFEYTNTPEVHSGEYHFVIKDMYIPHPIENVDYCSNTIFILPFDISGKPKEDCFNEIGETLRNLNPETLLFLSHIKKIVCKIDSEEWILKRNDSPNLLGSKHLCTLSKNKAGTATTTSTHYIRFFDTIKINVSEKDENDIIKYYEKKIDIGIAFKAQLNEKSGWSIKPIIYNDNPAGKVFTFFPCEAEKSGLCFHIHAPFALTVDREKLRNEPGNEIIKNKIVDLLHSSLTKIREDNLLNMDFLKSLPNDEDDLGANENNSSNYEMFKRVFDFFNDESFTPMENGTYEPAKGKLRSKNRVGTLFTDQDMNILFNTENIAYWIKNPRQLNQRDDKFIQSLDCSNYNLNDFLDDYTREKNKYDEIEESLNNKDFVIHEGIKKIISRFEKVSEIFNSKKYDWFCKFYVQLESMISSYDNSYEYNDIQEYPFCFCSDSKLYKFSDCFIPTEGLSVYPVNVHFLNEKIYKEAKNNSNLNDFLDSIGIIEYSETEIFKTDFNTFINSKITVENFISIFRKFKNLPDGIDSLSSSFFKTFNEHKFIFSDDGRLYTPDEIYLTENYGCQIKNIEQYFNSLNDCSMHKISDEYLKLLKEDELINFISFITSFGCKNTITVIQTDCYKNRYWDYIWRNSPGYGAGNSLPTSIDFDVEGLRYFLIRPTFEKFEFVWSFLQQTALTRRVNWYERDISYCYYKTARKYPLKMFSSELRNILLEAKWVAQEENGTTIFVSPPKAYISKLPEYYREELSKTNYNLTNWFERLEFGKEERENEAEYQRKLEEERKQKEELSKLSENVGVPLDTLSELAQAQKEGLLTSDDIIGLIASKRRAKLNKEEFDSNNSQDDLDEERISEKAKENYDDADDIETEKKERSVRTSNSGIKDSAKSKLRNRYTSTLNGNMICQICQNPMPFKDKSDNDYFVTRQLFSSKIFEKEMDENYIALCPTCDAKYKVYMAQDDEKQNELKQAVIKAKAEQMEYDITLDEDYKLYFNKQHIISLYSCLSGEKIEPAKKAVVIIHKKSENNISKAFCVNCNTTFDFIKTRPVSSCPNCKTVYKNSNGTLQLMTSTKNDDLFFECPYCKRRIQKIHKENHLLKCKNQKT